MFVILGYVVVFSTVLGGFLMAGGHLGVLLQPSEFVIIFGAAGGAFLAANKPTVLKASIASLATALKGSKYTKELYLETLALLYNIFVKVRQNGLLSIEADIDSPKDSELFKSAPKVLDDHHAISFIVDYLRLMTSGNLEPYQIDNLMDLEIETHHQEGELPIQALQRLADGMPAFGIVAAVMGVVHTMESVGLPPEELGKLIAAALVGTFLGVLVAYGFVGPIAGLLEQKLAESTKYYQSLKAALMAMVNGYPPPISVEFARKVMFSTERPAYSELEEYLKNHKR